VGSRAKQRRAPAQAASLKSNAAGEKSIRVGRTVEERDVSAHEGHRILVVQLSGHDRGSYEFGPFTCTGRLVSRSATELLQRVCAAEPKRKGWVQSSHGFQGSSSGSSGGNERPVGRRSSSLLDDGRCSARCVLRTARRAAVAGVAWRGVGAKVSRTTSGNATALVESAARRSCSRSRAMACSTAHASRAPVTTHATTVR
jgi:hypothetical protein